MRSLPERSRVRAWLRLACLSSTASWLITLQTCLGPRIVTLSRLLYKKSLFLVLLHFLEPLFPLLLFEGLFDEEGVAATHVLHDFRGTDQIYQFVVHEILLPILFPDPESANCLAHLQNVVRFGVHLVGDVGHVAVEKGSDESCHHQNYRSVQRRETVASDYVLILIAENVEQDPCILSGVVETQPPEDLVGIDHWGVPRAEETEHHGHHIGVLVGSVGVGSIGVVDGSGLIGGADGAEPDELGIKLRQDNRGIAGGECPIDVLEHRKREVTSIVGIDKHRAAADGLDNLSFKLVIYGQLERHRRFVCLYQLLYCRVQLRQEGLVVRSSNTPVVVAVGLVGHTLELRGNLTLGHLLQGRHVGKPLIVELCLREVVRRRREVRSRVQGEGVPVLGLQSQRHFPTDHQVGLRNGVEVGEQDHGSENDKNDDDEASPANDLGKPGLYLSQGVIDGVVVLYLGPEGPEVDAELFEPIEEGETGMRKRPIDDDLELVEEGDGSVDGDCVVVDEAATGHQRVETLELFIAVFDLQGRQVEVEEVEERKPDEGRTWRVDPADETLNRSLVVDEERKGCEDSHCQSILQNELPPAGYQGDGEVPLQNHHEHVHQDSYDHVSTELEILGCVFDAEPLDVGHQGIEKDHVDHQQDLDGTDNRVEIHSDLPVGKDIQKRRLSRFELVHVVAQLQSSNSEGVVLLPSLHICPAELPDVQFRIYPLVHEHSQKGLFQILSLQLSAVPVALIPDHFLAQEDHDEEEVEVPLIVVDLSCVGIGIEQELDSVSLPQHGAVRLNQHHELRGEDEEEDVDGHQVHLFVGGDGIIAEDKGDQGETQDARVQNVVDHREQDDEAVYIGHQEWEDVV